MRVAFFILLLANGFMYLWQSYFVVPTAQKGLRLVENVPELVLLEETGTTVQAATSEAPAAKIETGTAEFTDDNNVAEDANSTDTSLVASVDAPDTPAPVTTKCFSVGPFTDEGVLDKAKELFAKNNIPVSQRTLTESELFGYNVLLLPFSSRDQAVKMVGVLREKGITDYYIMPDPELQNAISLGLFREHSFAVRHMTYVQSKGFAPKLHERYYDRSRHWLDYTETDQIIEEAAFARVSPDNDVQRLLRTCS